jgi:putative ABC transport system permease protein
MVSLARKSLIHGWRSFLPAMLAISFASLLLLMQAALVLGIFGSASVYVTGSDADVWVGYPGTQSVDQGRAIDANVAALLQMNPQVDRIEPFLWLDGDWRSASNDSGGVSVYVSGIETRPGSLMFSRVLPPALRALLLAPDAVVVDRAELTKLGVAIGGHAYLNGHSVQVVGVASGLRALGGVNVVASLETARRLDPDSPHPGWPTYYVAKLHDSAQADRVVGQINGHPGFGRYRAWTAEQFSRQSIIFWMFDTGAGAGVLFLAAIVFLVGALISSQTLVAAVVGSVREYATLNALGIGMPSLRWVVLEQACWLGILGAVGAIGLGAALIAVARMEDVPVVFSLQISFACVLVVMALAAVSGLAALSGLRRADTAVLLR